MRGKKRDRGEGRGRTDKEEEKGQIRRRRDTERGERPDDEM